MSKEEIKKKIDKVNKEEQQKEEKKDTKSKDQQILELISDLKRLQAEFENYKKRVDRDKEDFKQYACIETIKKLLPALDNFELALNNTEKHEEFVKGMELVYSQLFQSLEDMGITKIEAKGKQFDPYKYEALLSEKSNKAEGTVLEELQKGYQMKDKVIRHVKVKVAR